MANVAHRFVANPISTIADFSKLANHGIENITKITSKRPYNACYNANIRSAFYAVPEGAMMNPKQSYTPPILEPQPTFMMLTGVTLPIGTSGAFDPLDMDFLHNMDFMETEQ